MAKATTTIRQVLNHKPDHGAWFAANPRLFNQVAAFYFEVIQAHRRLLELGNKEALSALELLTHATEKNPTPVMPLSDIIGVEVGDMLTRVELFDLTLHKLGAVAYPAVLSEYQPEQVVEDIDQGVKAVLAEAGVTLENVLGIGVSVGGIVEQVEHVFAYIPSWGWRSVPLATLLEERFHMPIYLENAAKVMAQAEGLFGAGQGYEHVAVLLVATGIGAGIIADGSLYRGAGNSAGRVLKDTAHYLGVGIANLINLFNPQLILLGGWAGLQIGESILPELRQCVERYALKQPLSLTRIDLCADWGRQCQGLMEEIPWITRVQAHRPQHTIGRG
jgi:predicted NBD/HSP70 family sugar kinase